ncbi:MAG TPA: PLD nuclease N-terminal domain-containing protein [Candidatus Methylacidiphilales bacterium]
MGLQGILFFLFVLGSIFWIWALIDCLSKESHRGYAKIVWFLVIFFLHAVGAAVYVFLRRPERIAERGH